MGRSWLRSKGSEGSVGMKVVDNGLWNERRRNSPTIRQVHTPSRLSFDLQKGTPKVGGNVCSKTGDWRLREWRLFCPQVKWKHPYKRTVQTDSSGPQMSLVYLSLVYLSVCRSESQTRSLSGKLAPPNRLCTIVRPLTDCAQLAAAAQQEFVQGPLSLCQGSLVCAT